MIYTPGCRCVSIGLLAVCFFFFGCANDKIAKPDPVGPPPTFTGPDFLHGTVGSLCKLRGYDAMLVSGYSLVVNLEGTGSSEVPAFLRQWLINEMRKKGVSQMKMGMTPEQVLADPNTAVVLVEGLIPPGATKGTRFDVLVSALPQTQTTSLENGDLWRTDLSVDGDNPSMRFSRPLAFASGSMYLNPFEGALKSTSDELRRQAIIVGGGVVAADRQIELLMNSPSWQRSRAIADRINERFPRAPSDRVDTATAVNDMILRLNVPRRFAGKTEELLALIAHLYIQRSPNFEIEQAERLAQVLAEKPEFSGDVMLAWRALGKTALSVLRRYYDHPTLRVKLAALEAGARLDDEMAAQPLIAVAKSIDPSERARAAAILAHLPKSLQSAQTLAGLLDDADTSVRIAAYESLASINDPTIHRMSIGDNTRFKLMLDLVPATRPLIYVSHQPFPRIAVFNPDVGFLTPSVAGLFDNRLMLRVTEPGKPVSVFYQDRKDVTGRTYSIAPTAANLIFLMAQFANEANSTEGLDLPFSKVVGGVNEMSQKGYILAPVQVTRSPLATMIERTRGRTLNEPRPETTGTGEYIDIQPGTPTDRAGEAGPVEPEGRPETDDTVTPVTPMMP